MVNAHDSKGTHWFENKEASEHTGRLIEESGALLETEVARACHEFVLGSNNRRGVRTHTDSIVYDSGSEGGPLRQIDQCLSLYKEFALDERTGVQFDVHIPLEAKFRKDVEVFGVPYPLKSFRPRMPMVGFVRGTQLSRIVEPEVPFQNVPVVHPILLEIRGGKTPHRIHEENLTYNAASALYDFIRFDFGGLTGSAEESRAAEIIANMHLVERFEKYLEDKQYVWWSVILDWMKENLTNSLVKAFNRRIGAGRIHYSISSHIPVLCINGPIWDYSGMKFASCSSLLASVRTPRWPGSLRRHLIRYTAEAPLLITNVTGLASVFAECLDWFLRIEAALKAADESVICRWPIESAFYEAVVAKSLREASENQLRSDLDIFRWL